MAPASSSQLLHPTDYVGNGCGHRPQGSRVPEGLPPDRNMAPASSSRLLYPTDYVGNGRGHRPPAQCLKWRMPVKTIAMPYLLQASMES